MKKVYFLISVLLFVMAGVSFSQQKTVYAEGYIVKVGDQSPDFTIREAGGSSYKLSALRGKVVMLQFTASWCGVCRQEMPFIEKKYGSRGKQKARLF